MNGSQQIVERLDQRARHWRWTMLLSGVAAIIFALGVLYIIYDSKANEARRAADAISAANQLQEANARLDALARALDATRQQVWQCAADPPPSSGCDEPDSPPAADVIQDPSIVENTGPTDTESLTEAARTVIDSLLPGLVESEVASAVDSAMADCVASGRCTGPPGAEGSAGADGAPPSPGDVLAAVLAACRAELQCEPTAAQLAEAVGSYCGQPDEPCGKRWSEDEIYRIANRATVDYLSGRPVWCLPENEVANDQPFGPCYVSSG